MYKYKLILNYNFIKITLIKLYLYINILTKFKLILSNLIILIK